MDKGKQAVTVESCACLQTGPEGCKGLETCRDFCSLVFSLRACHGNATHAWLEFLTLYVAMLLECLRGVLPLQPGVRHAPLPRSVPSSTIAVHVEMPLLQENNNVICPRGSCMRPASQANAHDPFCHTTVLPDFLSPPVMPLGSNQGSRPCWHCQKSREHSKTQPHDLSVLILATCFFPQCNLDWFLIVGVSCVFWLDSYWVDWSWVEAPWSGLLFNWIYTLTAFHNFVIAVSMFIYLSRGCNYS